jgi:hypothetical protein
MAIINLQSFAFNALLFKCKLSRGEICVANFIPPCEWWESPKAISARFGTKRLFLEQKAMK